jgi:hypothetical protein
MGSPRLFSQLAGSGISQAIAAPPPSDEDERKPPAVIEVGGRQDTANTQHSGMKW